MSDKWEVVVRNKKEKNPNKNKPQITIPDEVKKNTNSVKKQIAKGVTAAPNLTDLEEDDSVVPNNQNKKNISKKPNIPKSVDTGKSGDVKKVKQPKTLEQCLALIDVNDIIQTFESNIGGTSVTRLLDVVRLFNSKITADQHDEVYSNQPLNYPASAVPSLLKKTLQKFLSETSANSLQAFLDLNLSSIANHMIKGGHATGYKIMIQLLGEMNPNLFLKSINKCNSLMASYQNRPPIGISLLWAAGQGGLHDIKVGLEVWKQLMLPRIDMRHYVKFAVMYLINLLKSHSLSKNESNKLDNAEVMSLLDFLNAKRKGMPKDLEGLLNNQASVLRKLYFEKSDAWEQSDMLESLLERLPSKFNGKKQLNDITTKEIIFCFIEGLRKKDSNYKLWRDVHKNYTIQTTYIIMFLDSNWASISPSLNEKQMNNTINYFKKAYGDLHKNNKEEEAYRLSHHICQKLTKKATKSRSFVWILGSILLIPIIASLIVVYDVQHNGSFEKSNTGQMLESMGVLEQSQALWYKSLSYSAKGYIWVENNVPYYYTVTVDFAKPYWELTKDMALIVSGQVAQLYSNIKEYIVEKWPLVQDKIEEYIPGFLSTIQDYSAKGWDAVKSFTVTSYSSTSTYLKTRIFIDNWAPEVLQKKTLEALNSTSLYALEYCSRFHQLVDHYSKLQ